MSDSDGAGGDESSDATALVIAQDNGLADITVIYGRSMRKTTWVEPAEELADEEGGGAGWVPPIREKGEVMISVGESKVNKPTRRCMTQLDYSERTGLAPSWRSKGSRVFVRG